MTTHEEGREYDIIFAGGGTAACVAAGRLARSDPSLKILLVEGGRNNLNDPTVVNPAIYLAHLAPDTTTALFYKGQAAEELNGREPIVPCGGILGGGSSINFMMYTRGQGVDYDSWETEGWTFKDLLPCFKRLETYHIDDSSIDKSLHGFDGPINISKGTHNPKRPQDDMIDAAAALDIPEVVDLQDFTAVGGISRWASYVSPDGKRQDAAHRYIHPLMQDKNCNVHLLLESKVTRVLFEGDRAVGVEYEPTGASQPEISLSKPTKSTVKATKLVVVSAGALGTPSVLERSGVGSKEILEKLDIPVVSDVPGVGENYQDHHLVLYPYRTSLKPDETIDGLLSGRLDFGKALEEHNPLLGWNSIDICSKLRPSDAEVDEMGPEFKELWQKDYVEGKLATKPMMLMGVVSSFLGDHKVLNEPADSPSQYCTMGAYTAYPYSRGKIHITSKDVKEPAEFHTGFMNHPADLTMQLWAYKKQREMYRRTNAYQGELELGHPKFAEGSKAALQREVAVKGGFKSVEERRSLPPIEYSSEDDEIIKDWIRANVNTTWHSIGTCKMAPKEKGGVVDKNLNVYGTKGLKLADLSICPENVGANTNNTALMVGEKAADVIAADLGIKVV